MVLNGGGQLPGAWVDHHHMHGSGMACVLADRGGKSLLVKHCIDLGIVSTLVAIATAVVSTEQLGETVSCVAVAKKKSSIRSRSIATAVPLTSSWEAQQCIVLMAFSVACQGVSTEKLAE